MVGGWAESWVAASAAQLAVAQQRLQAAPVRGAHLGRGRRGGLDSREDEAGSQGLGSCSRLQARGALASLPPCLPSSELLTNTTTRCAIDLAAVTSLVAPISSKMITWRWLGEGGRGAH